MLNDRTYPQIVNTSHVFQVKKESDQIDYCKDFHGDSDSKHNYKKENTYRDAHRKIRIRNIFKHLKQLEKPKIRMEKRFTLSKF